ncbi:MAG: alcohol dehydrogenase catalytic domain-containing protein, partial [Bacteroidota bacterium]
MSTIKSIELQALGGPDQYKLIEGPLPVPGPNEVRVRVEATGIAYADVMMRHGAYPGTPAPPFVPGYDIVGFVEAVGREVSPSWMGKRISALIQRGGYAEAAIVPAKNLVEVPSTLDAAQAQALNLNYVSAWQMLHRITKVKSGQRILVQGAAGGVGTALVQLARHHGVEVWGPASAGKHHLLTPYGVHAIDYKTEDVFKR